MKPFVMLLLTRFHLLILKPKFWRKKIEITDYFLQILEWRLFLARATEDNLRNKDDLKNEDDLKSGDNLKNEDDLKNEADLEIEDDLKNWPILKNVTPPPLSLKSYLIFFMMTSHRDSHSTTDV